MKDPIRALATETFRNAPGDCTCGKANLPSLTEGHASGCARWKLWFKVWNEAVRLKGIKP